MIPFPGLVSLLAASLTVCSQPVPQSPAGNYILPGVLSDVAYHDGLTLDAYAPAGEPRPAAVIVHGSQGDKRTHITQLFGLLDHAGYAWFSPDYHSRDDVAEAIRFIRCPGRFNITTEMVLIGEDIGAQIALAVASGGGFRGIVTFGAKIDDAALGHIIEMPFSTPVVMFHGTRDSEASPSRVEALCKKIKNCVFHPVAGGIHNFENWHPDQWDWKEELTAWLREDRRGLWKDIAYSRPGGRELLMDAFIPEGRGPFPGVIIVHGGGWEAGDKVTYVSPVFEPLARAGMAWFSIDYRLTPYVHIPEQLEDVRTAIRYVRQHASRFHVDPSRIAVLGESASGHLVAQVAWEPCSGCEIQAVLSFYGVYDFTKAPENSEWRGMLGRLFGHWTSETLRHYSPLYNVKPGMPPVFLLQGTEDELCKGTLEYAKKLKAAHARYKLLLLKGAPHGMENWEGHPEWSYYKPMLVEWLRETLSSRRTAVNGN